MEFRQLNEDIKKCDLTLAFRILSFCYIFVCATINILLCFSADDLHNEAKEAKECICLKIVKENVRGRLDADIYQTASIIMQRATTDVGITALGFFTVSRAALLAIYSFIATYVVILLQTPRDLSDETAALNATVL
uniref:Gustatory receptor 3 n=1 Tax=Plectus sambesii TaxID=2011161 RepID=A0A914WZ32_9BILA